MAVDVQNRANPSTTNGGVSIASAEMFAYRATVSTLNTTKQEAHHWCLGLQLGLQFGSN